MTANSEHPIHLTAGIYEAARRDFEDNPDAQDDLWKLLSHDNLPLAVDILLAAQRAAEAGRTVEDAAIEATLLIMAAFEKARSASSIEAQLDQSLATVPPAA